MTKLERIMIPPLLDQEGRPSHTKRNVAILGFIVVVAILILLRLGW